MKPEAHEVGNSVELASNAEVRQLLATFQEDLARFEPPLCTGGFGNGLRHAHQLGRLGADSNVAVVDVGFDLKHPGLRGGAVQFEGINEPGSDHGTCVALLVRAAAPKCNLTLIGIPKEQLGDPEAVGDAILRAGDLGGDVVNLSIQHSKLADFLDLEFHQGVEAVIRQGPLGLYEREMPPCPVCMAVDSVQSMGSAVVAAAGNRSGYLSCPARSDSSLAVGLIREDRELFVEGASAFENAVGAAANQPVSMHFDVSVRESDQRLQGTSFAAPLFSGLVALGLKPAETKMFAEAQRLESVGAGLLAQLRAAGSREVESLHRCQDLYRAAWQRLPHSHVPTPTEPAPPPADDCPFCGILALQLYVNYGLLLLQMGRLEHANQVLRIACTLAPWDPHAHANLGAVLREQARYCFQRAVDLGDLPVHRHALAALNEA